MAVILLAPAVSLWVSRGTSTDDAVFGRIGTLATGFIAISVTAVAAVVSYLPVVSGGIRWGLGLAMAIIAAAVSVAALSTLFSARHRLESVIDVFLLLAAGAMIVVGGEVARRRTPLVGTGNHRGEPS